MEHRWFLSERAGREIPIFDAAADYVETVLRGLPDEEVAISSLESMGPLANPYDPSQGFVDDDAEKPYDPWEDDQGEAEDEDVARRGFLDIAALRARAGEAGSGRA